MGEGETMQQLQKVFLSMVGRQIERERRTIDEKADQAVRLFLVLVDYRKIQRQIRVIR
jgi:hypothetical protein